LPQAAVFFASRGAPLAPAASPRARKPPCARQAEPL